MEERRFLSFRVNTGTAYLVISTTRIDGAYIAWPNAVSTLRLIRISSPHEKYDENDDENQDNRSATYIHGRFLVAT